MTTVLEIRKLNGSEVQKHRLDRQVYVIGREPQSERGNAIVVQSHFIKKDHASLEYSRNGWVLTPLQPQVRRGGANSQPLQVNTQHRFRNNTYFMIGDLEFKLLESSEDGDAQVDGPSVEEASLDALINETLLRVTEETQRMAATGDLSPDDADYRSKIRPIVKRTLNGLMRKAESADMRAYRAEATRRDMIFRILGHPGLLHGAVCAEVTSMDVDALDRVQNSLLKALNIDRAKINFVADLAKLAEGFRDVFRRNQDSFSPGLLNRLTFETAGSAVEAMMDGIGPLEPLMAIEEISEIMVVGPRQVFVEIGGVLVMTGLGFVDESSSAKVATKIVSNSNNRLDRSTPYQDARLPNGSRVNAVIPPIAIHGTALTVRKFRESPLTLEDLLGFGCLSNTMASFLQGCVVSKQNIVVSGGTGTGKTTMINWLTSMVPPGERIVTVEDTAELRLPLPHVVSLEARPATPDSPGHTIRDLTRNALRMRPDRIIVGECRGGEAFDMLQAMNTGHEGSMTTVHANNPVETMARIENLVMTAGESLPLAAIRFQVAGAVDYVVQLRRYADGARKVCDIAEIGGVDPVSGQIEVNPIFEGHYVPGSGEPADFNFAGRTPEAIDRIIRAGFDPSLLGFDSV